MLPRLILVLLVVVISMPAFGQIYAPETEYHDITQRVFAVEAARVVAWHRAANGGPSVVEVAYDVSVTPSRETVWKIQWLDAAKKPIREREVRYAEAKLVEGAQFYRDILLQIEGDDWKIGAGSPDNAATTFWQGAELSGATRFGAVKAARTLVREKPKMARAADAARMAGILSHATLPHFNRQVSLDPVALGRAAAWLCIAEAKSREKFDAAWVSILFLSGREKAAADLSATALWRPDEKQSAGERFWRLMCSRPSAKDMLLFAARTENKSFALPMLGYAASLDASLAASAAEVGENVLGSDAMARVTEYPLAANRSAPTAAQKSAEALNEFLNKWDQARSEFEPAELDNTGYHEATKMLQPLAGSETVPARLRRLAPLLNLGFDQGRGALAPTPHITPRDVFVFVWETVCESSAECFETLSQPGGDAEQAKAFRSATLGSIKGSNVFFGEKGEKILAPIDTPARVQHVSSEKTQAALLKNPPPTWSATPDLPLRRQWLSRVATRESVAHLIDAKISDGDFKVIVERLMREGGRAIALDLSRKEPLPRFAEAIERAGLRDAITAMFPVLGEVDPKEIKPGSSPLPGATSGPTATGAEAVEKFEPSAYKTAEEFWAALEKVRDIPKRASNSPEDRMRQVRAWLDTRRVAAEAFIKAYPNDPHRHSAKLIAIDSILQLERFGDQSIAKLDGNELDVIINAVDADDTTKGEAQFFKLMVDSREVHYSSPHTLPPFQQALAAYLEKYPKHERSQYVGAMLVQTLSTVETPSTEPLLKKLAQSPNEQIAAQAKSLLQRRQFMLELKKKPLDLKFTALDGKEVDLGKLRGKVVLLDFWASWCGPCMADAPHVVATYQKLRERGFEIIGISLDDDKAAMEAALKSAQMTWPQHFDGKGWNNEIAQRFGIRSIPATWLFDKQGKLREHGLRGKELEARIENLLKEK